MLVIKIYEYHVHADEVLGYCYLKCNTSYPWIFFLLFSSCGLFEGRKRRRQQKGLEDVNGVRLRTR